MVLVQEGELKKSGEVGMTDELLDEVISRVPDDQVCRRRRRII